MQHIYRSLKADGKARAAVVLPDNVLFADGDGERIRHFDAFRPPVPRDGFQHARMELKIVEDAMLVRIAAAHHADVGGIGDGRIDGTHTLDHGAVLEELAEACVVLQEVFDVFPDHGVAGENNNSIGMRHKILIINGLRKSRLSAYRLPPSLGEVPR